MAEYQQRLRRTEAMEVTADSATEVATWCGGFANPQGGVVFVPAGGVMIPASAGQYVMRNASGYAVLDAESFEREWEPAPEANA